MDRCEGPFYRKTKVYTNQRGFASHRGQKWTQGINIDPAFNYGPCTLIKKHVVEGKVVFRPFMPGDGCYDAVLRCGIDFEKDDIPEGRACAVCCGEIYADAIDREYIPDVDLCDIASNDHCLSITQQICGGLGNVADEEKTEMKASEVVERELAEEDAKAEPEVVEDAKEEVA